MRNPFKRKSYALTPEQLEAMGLHVVEPDKFEFEKFEYDKVEITTDGDLKPCTSKATKFFKSFLNN